MQNIYQVHNIDARKINNIVSEPVVDVTITSPPYFDMKDYGSDNQIGYGQKYDEYLKDLKLVFDQVYKITKETGTLWVIIDVFRRDGEVVPLPFDFSNKIKEVGWKLQEVIIWGKDRTVPWAHKGQMRSMFEYVLMFSKNKDYHFNIDKVRDFQSLKKWWVKYPERYNPRGKTPDAIWNFDIPTQGSWGSGYIKHFCPLPEDMIAQILKITTNEGDVVLDCFSGSGAVLSKADNMKRRYIGFELNEDYINMFDNYLKETGIEKRKEYELEEKGTMKQDSFEKLILDLRALKFARVLLKKLIENNCKSVAKIYVERISSKPISINNLALIKYLLLIDSSEEKRIVEKYISEIVKKPPLSKFGIEAKFILTKSITEFKKHLNSENLYVYTIRSTHKFKKQISIDNILLQKPNDSIISSIKANLEESDYG